MPLQGTELYRDRNAILASFLAAYQAAIPDVWISEDGNLRILLEIESGQIEGLYLANQILLEDMFVQTANYAALLRHGEQYGLPRKVGTYATGQILFSGQGGTEIPVGTEVAYDPGSGADTLYYTTTNLYTIPNPGVPTPPAAVDHGAGGAVDAGTYEYVVTFLTLAGETLPGDPSNAITIAATHSIDVTIPLGGPGTIQRKLYRSLNGGSFQLVATVADNVTTVVNDNNNVPGVSVPPTVSTAESVLADAQSENTGLLYNAVAGAIVVPSAVPNGITGVTNPVPFVGGSDPESFDDYRNRLLTFLRSPETGGPDDLITWALGVDGVESVTVFPNDNMGVATPGHVTVRISSPGGTVPTTDIIDQVAAVYASKDIATITLHVTSFTPSPLNVTVHITTVTGYALADITPNIINTIDDYIATIPVGGTIYVAGIIQHVMEVVGVADVTVSAPAANQVAAATNKFVPGVITVS